MPNYDYICPLCNCRVTILKPIAEIDKKEICPNCPDTPMIKKIGSPTIIYPSELKIYADRNPAEGET